MRSSTSNIAAGLFSLLVAAVFYHQSSELEDVSRMYAMLLLGFIFLGGLLLVAQGVCGKLRGKDTVTEGEPVTMSRVGLISVLAIAYVLIIPFLGFYAASILFLFGSAMLLNDAGGGLLHSLVSACILTAVLCLAVWGGFALLLGVPTPEGMLF